MDTHLDRILVEVEGNVRARRDTTGEVLQALEQGVRDVHIVNGQLEHVVLLELFTASGVGTMLSDAG